MESSPFRFVSFFSSVYLSVRSRSPFNDSVVLVSFLDDSFASWEIDWKREGENEEEGKREVDASSREQGKNNVGNRLSHRFSLPSSNFQNPNLRLGPAHHLSHPLLLLLRDHLNRRTPTFHLLEIQLLILRPKHLPRVLHRLKYRLTPDFDDNLLEQRVVRPPVPFDGSEDLTTPRSRREYLSRPRLDVGDLRTQRSAHLQGEELIHFLELVEIHLVGREGGGEDDLERSKGVLVAKEGEGWVGFCFLGFESESVFEDEMMDSLTFFEGDGTEKEREENGEVGE